MSMEKNSLKSERLLCLKLFWDLEGADFGLELAVKQQMTGHRQFSSPAYRGIVFPTGSHKPRQLYSHLLPVCTVHGSIFSSHQLFFTLGLLIFSSSLLVCVIHQFALSCFVWQLVIKDPSDCHSVPAHQPPLYIQIAAEQLQPPSLWSVKELGGINLFFLFVLSLLCSSYASLKCCHSVSSDSLFAKSVQENWDGINCCVYLFSS